MLDLAHIEQRGGCAFKATGNQGQDFFLIMFIIAGIVGVSDYVG